MTSNLLKVSMFRVVGWWNKHLESRPRLLRILQFVFSCTLIGFILTRVGTEQIHRSFELLSLTDYFPAIFAISVSQALVALRWKLYQQQYSVATLFKVLLTGQLYNYVLASNLSGDVARYLYLRKGDGHNPERLAVIVVDRFVSMLAMMVLGLASMMHTRFEFLEAYVLPVSIITITLTLVLLFARLGFVGLMVRLIANRIFKTNSRMASNWVAVESHIRLALQSNYKVLGVFLLSGIYQVGMTACSFFLGTGLGMKLGFVDYQIISSMSQILMIIPLGFGGIGIKEVVAYVILQSMSQSNANAAAFLVAPIPIVLLFVVAGIFAENSLRHSKETSSKEPSRPAINPDQDSLER